MKKADKKSFGSFLKKLRLTKGYSIKKLSNELSINYSYLSKIENGHSLPSDEFITRIAGLFGYDNEELLARAGKIPDDVIKIISDNPKIAIEFLRKEFSG
ncbi:MAG: helix-turn-helix transcriptional regulator [Desulfobaccales bacterium]|jgi:transcriptional regulator with XRE-family HTH domain